MSDPTFMARLAQAIQQQHESTMALQQLASELVDHAMRMRSWTDKLQAHLVAPETPAVRATLVQAQPYANEAPMDMRTMPLVLRGGPQVRDG